MIDNVKELSRAEKIKRIERQYRTKTLLKCVPAMILGGSSVAVYGMFMFGNLIEAFQNNIWQSIFQIILSISFMIILFHGCYEFITKKKNATRNYYIISMVVAIAYVISMSVAKMINIYILPIVLATFIIMELMEKRAALLATMYITFMSIVTFVFSNEQDAFILSQAISSVLVNTICAMLVLFMEKLHFSRIKFLIVSLLAPLMAQPINLILTVIQGDISINLLFNVLYSMAGNIGAALIFMPLVTVFETVFNIADDFRLNELCSLSSPLLKRLASEAPGTFNHSLVVGNLAEACASAIGENPNMARCGAYYHDIGKLKAPIYFSENQSTYNPHDELIPEVSVSMITSHTLFGEILAKQARLPKEIVDICRQHHGTSPVSYFYRKALTLKEEGDLAVDEYRYSGPNPQTKITAVIMIADTVEAAMRAYMPDTKEEYVQRIEKLIDEKISNHQFDECPITMGDIAIIKKTIIEVLPSIHHSRINYDKANKK